MSNQRAVDLAEFEVLSGRTGKRCGMSALDLPPEKAEKLAAALTARGISAKAIAAVLASWGHPVSHQIVQRHRNGTCSCGK